MSFEEVEFEIDGKIYRYTPLMAKAARDTLVQLVNNLGPTLGKSIKELSGSAGSITEKSDVLKALPAFSGSLGEAVIQFSTSITPQYYAQLVDLFLCRVETDDEEGSVTLNKKVRDTMFARSLFLETKILLKCLGAQYEDFFLSLKVEIATALAKLLAMKESRSKSPDQSTGTSIESQQANGTESL